MAHFIQMVVQKDEKAMSANLAKVNVMLPKRLNVISAVELVR